MFGSNFIESSSKNCAFCNSTAPEAGTIITHIGAQENSCTYHANCVATEILQNDCPKCQCPINPRSLEQFKTTRTVEPIRVVNLEEEAAAQLQLQRELDDHINGKAIRELQQQLDLEELEEKQSRVEAYFRGEIAAQRLQAEFDAQVQPNPTDDDFAAAMRLHEELNAVQQWGSNVMTIPAAAFAERTVPQNDPNNGIRRCDLLSYVTRNRLIGSAAAIVFVACMIGRF